MHLVDRGGRERERACNLERKVGWKKCGCAHALATLKQ